MNITTVPNHIIDNYMNKLNANTFKVLILIIRKTMGWGKTKDGISLSLICEHTGISKPTVIKGLDELIKLNLIEKEYSKRENGGNSFNYYNLTVSLINECNNFVKKIDKPNKKYLQEPCKENLHTKETNKQKKLEQKEIQDTLKPKDIIEFYKNNISHKHQKIKEQLSFNLLSLNEKNLEKIMRALKNYSQNLPAEKYIVNLQSFVRDKIYEDYQKIEKNEVTKVQVPQDLINRKFVIGNEPIQFKEDGYFKLEKNYLVSNISDVEKMIDLVRGVIK